MVLPVVLVIAVAAGLAAAAVALLLGRRRSSGFNRGPRSGNRLRSLALPAAAFVVVAVLVGAVLLAFTGTGARPETRLLLIIERHHPETKAEIDAIAKEPDSVVAQNTPAALAQRYFPRHLATTSDEAVLRFTGEMTAIFEDLFQRDPQTCKALAAGGAMGAGIERQSLRRALDAMADVIEDSVDAAQAPPDAARAQALLGTVVAKVYAAKNDALLPPQALAQAQSAPADKLCRTMIAFYREILSLPPQDSSTLLRMLMRATKP